VPCEGFAEEGGLIVATGLEACAFDREGEDEVDYLRGFVELARGGMKANVSPIRA